MVSTKGRTIAAVRTAHNRGTVMVYTVVAIFALMGLISFAVDYGRIQVSKTEMQRAADAAARYATQGLSDSTAVSKAITAAGQNNVDGSPMVLQASDVEIGVWDSTAKTFTVTATNPNAVRVTARRTTARGTAIPTVFARAFGRTSFDVSYTAIATAPSASNLVMLHRFNESSGSTAYDEIDTPLNVVIQNVSNITWTGGGLQFNSSTRASSAAAASKLHTRLRATNRLTVIGQIKAGSTSQGGPARIISLSTDTNNRNFTLGQEGRTFRGRLRTTGGASPGDSNGMSEVITGNAITSTSQLIDVAMIYNGSTLRVRWRNQSAGTSGSTSISRTGTFNNWNTTYRLHYGNELTNDRTWLGEILHMAVYDIALNDTEIDTFWNGNLYLYNGSGSGGSVATVK